MKIPIIGSVFQKVGIDLGSSRIRVLVEGEGVVVDEPSCLAVDTTTRQVLAVGDDALAMFGRVGKEISLQFPVTAGVIADADVTKALLRVMLRKVSSQAFLVSPVMMVTVPANSTNAQREDLVQLLYELGAREVYTIAEPLAASIGAGVPIADASGCFMFHMGAGVSEVAVISLGSVVSAVSTRRAGNYLAEFIQHHLRSKLDLQVSKTQTQKVVARLAEIDPKQNETMLVSGKDVRTGNPTEVEIVTEDILPVVKRYALHYQLLLKEILQKVPPELTVDAIDKGLLLSGGSAQLKGLDRYLVKHIGMPISVVDEPDLVAIQGVGITLQHLDEYKKSLSYQERM